MTTKTTKTYPQADTVTHKWLLEDGGEFSISQFKDRPGWWVVQVVEYNGGLKNEVSYIQFHPTFESARSDLEYVKLWEDK